MKTKDIIVMIAFLVAGGCASNDEVQQKKNPVPIRLTASVGVEVKTRSVDPQGEEHVVMQTPATRGVQETAIASGEKVYVWGKEGTNTSWTYLQAWDLTSDGSNNLSGTPKYYPLNGLTLTMAAVHGNFAETLTEGSTAIGTLTHSVMADQETAGNYEKSDLLWGTATGSDGDASVNIPFIHKLSKIEVTLTPGYGYTDDDLTTEKVQVHLHNVKPSIVITTADGTLGSASGDVITITPRKNTSTGAYEAVIPSQTFTNPDALISVTTNNLTLTPPATLTSTVPNTVATFEGNTKYQYTTRVNIYDPGIELSNATTSHLGMVIAANGKMYTTKEIADCYSEGVAMIGHITSTGHGYALSLWNAGNGVKSVALSTASSYSKSKPAGTSWVLPSMPQWCYIFASCGGSAYGTDTNCQAVNYSSGNLRAMMTACGGEDFTDNMGYWSSTSYTGYSYASSHDYTFYKANSGAAGITSYWCVGQDTNEFAIRPCLTF